MGCCDSKPAGKTARSSMEGIYSAAAVEEVRQRLARADADGLWLWTVDGDGEWRTVGSKST